MSVHTFLKNLLSGSGEVPGPSFLFSRKLTVVMKPVPKRDFSLMEVPMQRSLPLAMIPILSPKISASSIECIVSMMARPFFDSCIMSHTCLLVIGSIPVVYNPKICVSVCVCVFIYKHQRKVSSCIAYIPVHRERPAWDHQ